MPKHFSPGKLLRFPEIASSDPLIICPLDDLLISGPINGLENPRAKILDIASARPTAVLAFPGIFQKYPAEFHKTKRIVNLSASTTKSLFNRKTRIGSIDTALRLHASAVAMHINICSIHAEQMIANAAFIFEQAEKYDMPTVAICYARGENQDGEVENFDSLRVSNPEEFTNIVAHCATLAVDLGADLIKTNYSGSLESFRKVILAAQGTPVVTAGGPIKPLDEIYDDAVRAYAAGAAGTSFARNCFGREYPGTFMEDLRLRLVSCKEHHKDSVTAPRTLG